MCGYQGAHVIPPSGGCRCTECSSYTGFCSICAEPKKRAKEQWEEEEKTGEFHHEIIKCKECISRMIEYSRQQ
jgi:hypothetical protein